MKKILGEVAMWLGTSTAIIIATIVTRSMATLWFLLVPAIVTLGQQNNKG